jgi:predicted  nucleic acid-binding Zn-ribbon protein
MHFDYGGETMKKTILVLALIAIFISFPPETKAQNLQENVAFLEAQKKALDWELKYIAERQVAIRKEWREHEERAKELSAELEAIKARLEALRPAKTQPPAKTEETK